jgi:hypothetical protein
VGKKWYRGGAAGGVNGKGSVEGPGAGDGVVDVQTVIWG